jgi:hypothetical protein
MARLAAGSGKSQTKLNLSDDEQGINRSSKKKRAASRFNQETVRFVSNDRSSRQEAF